MCADTPDYKDTIFLPETDFPMRAGLPQREPAWLERWENIGVYDRLRQKKGRPSFVLHDGPPYANGNLHIGHALNKILKDMVVRSQQMMGKDSRYVPGWDCHGLPIEWKIEEQYRAKGLNKDAVDVVAFRQECRKFAEGWVDIQREEFKRLGVTGNWDDPYKTMDFHSEAVIAAEFQKLLMNGALYQGSKPVMWSPVEKTALAEAEVEYHDVTSHSVWVRFPIVSATIWTQHSTLSWTSNESPQNLADLRGASIVIWTTTPWTIPQNKAISFGTEIEYGLYEVVAVLEGKAARPGEKLIVADSLSAATFAQAGVTESRRIRTIASRDVRSELRGLLCTHPLHSFPESKGEWDFTVQLLPGDHVTDDTGTGFVHTAPSHGDDDYQLGLKFGLPMTYNVLEDGSYRPDLPLFGGQHIILPDGKEGPANVSVIKALHAAGALFAKGKLKHSYPHSWRSKAPVIYRNTPQWFAAIDREIGGDSTYGKTIRERALTSIDTLVEWTPQTGRNRLHAMIEARPDWVLSRQRAWGVPLTCFTRKGRKPTDADFLLRDEAVNARITAAFEAEGADAWYQPGAKARFLGNGYDPEDWDQVTDILDVWFDSGSTHAFVLRDRPDGTKDGIADLYLEGTDQHRGWFHSSLLQACGTKGRAPYKAVLTHGFTLDEKGMKMSKSVGNTVAPEKVVKEYGADILRLWVAQSDYTADLRIGPEILKNSADSYRRLRNTLRFMLGNLKGFSEAERVDAADMPELERWVLHRLAELDAAVRDGYAKYDFQGVFQSVFQFCTSDLSAFYFDIRKDSLYCDAVTSLRRRSARTVLDLLFHRLVTWLAPVLVFTMEEVWLERFPGDASSVHLVDFPDAVAGWKDAELAAKWLTVRQIRSAVTYALEKERENKVIGSSLEAHPTVYLGSDESMLEEFGGIASIADILPEVCITSDLTVTTGMPKGETGSRFVKFDLAQGDKCQRCWRILPDVGTHAHAGVCARCDEALG